MDLNKIISNEYLIKIIKIDKNVDSTDGNVYIIKADKKYVLKIYDNEKHVHSMIQLHEFLSSNNFHVPKIIRTKDGKACLKYEDKFFVIYTFLDGRQINEFKKIPSKIIERFARELRRFHNITSNNDYNLDKVSYCEYEGVRQSVLHFDLTKDNMFYKDDKIGFIDFDDAKYGPSVCDVAIAVSLLFISKSRGLDKEGLTMFIDKYYGDDLKLKSEEINLIPRYATNWIEYVTHGHEFDTSTKESFDIKKKLLEDNIDLFK